MKSYHVFLFATFQAQQIHELAVQIGEKVAKAESLGKSYTLHVRVGYMDHLLRNFMLSYPGFSHTTSSQKHSDHSK